MATIAQRIERFVNNQGRATTQEIAEHLKMPTRSISSTLTHVARRGNVVRLHRGVYAPARYGDLQEPEASDEASDVEVDVTERGDLFELLAPISGKFLLRHWSSGDVYVATKLEV